jgi:pilus assembly protein CpaC
MSLIQTAVLVSLIAAFGLAISGRAPAAEPPLPAAVAAPAINIVTSEAPSQFVPLGVGKSVVIDFPRDIKDVLVGDPKIANAVIRSTRRAYIIGAAVGQTSVYFFDGEGHQIGGFDIAVTRDLNGLRAAIKQALPGSTSTSRDWARASCSPGTSPPRSRRNRPSILHPDWLTMGTRWSTASRCTAAIRSCSR